MRSTMIQNSIKPEITNTQETSLSNTHRNTGLAWNEFQITYEVNKVKRLQQKYTLNFQESRYILGSTLMYVLYF